MWSSYKESSMFSVILTLLGWVLVAWVCGVDSVNDGVSSVQISMIMLFAADESPFIDARSFSIHSETEGSRPV